MNTPWCCNTLAAFLASRHLLGYVCACHVLLPAHWSVFFFYLVFFSTAINTFCHQLALLSSHTSSSLWLFSPPPPALSPEGTSTLTIRKWLHLFAFAIIFCSIYDMHPLRLPVTSHWGETTGRLFVCTAALFLLFFWLFLCNSWLNIVFHPLSLVCHSHFWIHN